MVTSRQISPHGAEDPSRVLGPRIRRLRQEQGLTLVALGERTGLTHAFLSQVERGLANPSLRTLGMIASALGVSVGTLLQVPIDGELVSRVTRAGDPESVIFTGDDDSFTMYALTARTSTFHALLADGHHPATRVGGHEGEELVLVLEGELEMTVDGEKFHLEEGDALVFDGSRPHVYRTLGDVRPRFLVVVGDRAGVRSPTLATTDD